MGNKHDGVGAVVDVNQEDLFEFPVMVDVMLKNENSVMFRPMSKCTIFNIGHIHTCVRNEFNNSVNDVFEWPSVMFSSVFACFDSETSRSHEPLTEVMVARSLQKKSQIKMN